MSPEQARGDEVSPASDVFSIGLSLYQVLTGRTIYDAVEDVDATSGEQVLMYLGALLHSGGELTFRFPRTVPRAIQRVVERACRFDPAQRYADAGALRTALLEAQAAGAVPQSAPAVRWIARIALVMLLGLGAAGAWYGYRHAGVRAPEIPPFYQAAIERLRDANSTVATRLAMVSQMGADHSAGATRALIAASSDASPQVAVEAVKQLTRRVDERVAAQLIALLESPEFTVRAWAARGLGEASWRPALPALEARLAREDQSAAERQIRQAIERIQSPVQGGQS
jgi:hypothetical protein